MKPETYKAEIDTATSMNRFLKLVTFMLATGLVLMALAVYHLAGRERTVLVPPTINKTFWVDADKVSGEYLQEMALFITHLDLDVTPESVGFQGETIVKYAAPETYGPLKASLAAYAAKIKKDGATTLFKPHDWAIDEQNMKVSINGNLATFIADKKVSDVQKSYLVEFAYRSGKIYVKSFQEVPLNDPFNNNKNAPVANGTPAGQ